MSQSLNAALAELYYCCEDFESAGYKSADGVLARLVDGFDREPLQGLISAVLPDVDFAAWWRASLATKGATVGSGALNWPTDRAERVAMQLELCRAIVQKEPSLTSVLLDFCYSGSNRLADHALEFSRSVLRTVRP